MNIDDLIGYCGAYARACARWREHPHFRQLARVMAESVDAQGYRSWLPDTAPGFDYEEFRKGLDFFGSDGGPVVCVRCCKGGDGPADCAIRLCCRERGHELCFDCEEFPCGNIRDNAAVLKRGEEYHALGRDEWLRRQVTMAEQGFELHTGKYYRVYADQRPQAQAES